MDDFLQHAQEIIAAGKTLYQMGMVPATSGNFSCRLANGNIAITVSGKHKGRLTEADIMLLDASGNPLDERRPSAEAGLHVQIYQHFPEAGAILHPHAMSAVLLSQLHSDFIVISDYELLKAFPGINSHNVSITIPIFENDQDIPRLATAVENYLQNNERIFAYVIAGHGFYTWGQTMSDAMRHVEALDYLFNCERMKGGN